MFEQMDGQLATAEKLSKSAPLVSQDDMKNYFDSLIMKDPTLPSSILELADPYGQSGSNDSAENISKPKVPVDGGPKKPLPAEAPGGEKKRPAPLDPVLDESKPAEPRDGGAKSIECTPEDSTGLGIELPPLEIVDPRVEDARRRLDRIERAGQ